MNAPSAARAFLRVLALFLIQLAGITCCLLFLAFLFRLEPARVWQEWRLPEPVASIYGVCFFALAVANILLCHKHLNGYARPFRALGMWPPRWAALGLGWLAAATSLTLLCVAELAAGWLRWAPVLPSEPAQRLILLQALGTAVAIAFMEELLFRGYILQTLLPAMPRVAATLAASLIYALLHFIRPFASWTELLVPLCGLMLVGIVLCQAYFLAGSLWLPMGLHGGWVFLIALINMLHTDKTRLWEVRQEYVWLTGGNYPVTGLLGVVMLGGLWTGLVALERRQSRPSGAPRAPGS